MSQSHDSLSWIDDLWAQTGQYIIMRPEDGVLILPPNRVYRLNKTAEKLLRWLQSGKSICTFPGLDDEKCQQVESFFRNIDLALDNKPHSATRIPYTFDYNKLPILGEIAVTYRCNNRCRFCYAGCDGACGRLDSKDLPPERIERIIDIFKNDAKIPFFSFTGGEPLLRNDLERLMKYACNAGLRINLVTNGSLATKERAKSLYEAGLRTAQISLESPDESIHDALCGRKGAWQQTINGIENLRDAGIHVQTNTTSTRLNIDSLIDMPALCKRLGCVRMSLNLFIPTKRSPQTDPLFIPYEEIGKNIDAVRNKAVESDLEFHWYSPIPICIYNPISRGLGNKSCAACDGLISVDPEGNVLPCSSWDESVGNLLTDGFENVWFNERAQAIKHKCFAHSTCQNCSAFTACQGACPLYWQYAGYDELLKYSLSYQQLHNKKEVIC